MEPNNPEIIHSGDEIVINPNEEFKLVPDFENIRPRVEPTRILLARVYIEVPSICSGTVRFTTNLLLLRELLKENDPVIFELPRLLDINNLREVALKKPYGLPVGFEFDLTTRPAYAGKPDILRVTYRHKNQTFIGVPFVRPPRLIFAQFAPEGTDFTKTADVPHFAPFEFVFQDISFRIQANT